MGTRTVPLADASRYRSVNAQWIRRIDSSAWLRVVPRATPVLRSRAVTRIQAVTWATTRLRTHQGREERS
jgi:hypothetical protein